jgi:hypothetical protein
MAGASNAFPTGFRDNPWHGANRNGMAVSKETTPSGFPLTRNDRAGVLNGLLRPGPRRPRPHEIGMPLSELLGRALADASGEEYRPARLAEIEDVLGSESFSLLMQNPKIAMAIKLWANASNADRASLIKPLATLIAHEVGQPNLDWRIRQEVAKLK